MSKNTQPEVVEAPAVEEAPPAPKQNPLLSRRMVNAYARLSGCGEFSPETRCEHRIEAERTMNRLLALYEVEKS